MTVTKVPDNDGGASTREDHDHVPFLDDTTKNANLSSRTKSEKDSANNNEGLVQNVQNSKKEAKSKDSSVAEEESLAVLVTVPPDGGWGWVVVAASFLANFIVDGILYCYGVFIPIIMEDFKESAATVSIPGSLLAGFYLMAGPFVSVLANKYGFQRVTVAGAIFAAASFALSSLAMNVEYLIFTYGVLGGIGFGMVYSPSIVAVGYYFERWRAIATGIAVCGSGIGTFALSPLNDIFINTFDWKNTLLIHAGIILLLAVCGMMYRPIKPVKVAINEDLDDHEDIKPEDPLKSKEPLPERITNSGSILSLRSTKPPTAAEILHITGRPISADTTTTKLSKSSQSLNFNNSMIGNNTDLEKGVKRLSVPNIEDSAGAMGAPKPHKPRSLSQTAVSSRPTRRARTISEVSSSLSQGHSVELTIRSRRGTITKVDEKVPIQRDDAYFSGSLARLPQYKPEKDSISYTLSVTRIPPKKDKSRWSPAAVWDTIFELFDFSLLLSPSFNLLLFSGLLTMLGYFTPFSYLKDRAMIEGGWTADQTVWLISTIGITNTVGRVLSGLISGLPGMDATFINNVALMIAGIATMLSGISFSTTYQYAYCSIFGLSTGSRPPLSPRPRRSFVTFPGLSRSCSPVEAQDFEQEAQDRISANSCGSKVALVMSYIHIECAPQFPFLFDRIAAFASLRSIIVVDLLGLENLNNAFGILLFVQGFASALGSPLSGLVYNATKTYTASFYFSGALILLSGAVLIPLKAINRWEKKKKNQNFKRPAAPAC